MVLGAEVASAFDEFIESGKIAQLTDPEGRIGGYVNQQIGGADVVRANRVRRIAQKKMRELFQNFDVVATASLPVLASKINASAPCFIASLTAGLMLSLLPVSQTAKGALSVSI